VLREEATAVLACSALKDRIGAGWRRRNGLQSRLSARAPELIRERMKTRQHRYMPPALLDSQLATLEPPAGRDRASTSPRRSRRASRRS
jgi:gluconokinase